MGIMGALVMRGVFILAGVALIQRFEWITYLFGVFLVYSGYKLLRQGKQKSIQRGTRCFGWSARSYPLPGL